MYTLFGSDWGFDHHGIVAVCRLHAFDADRERRGVRHRSGGLKMEFHGIGAVGQDIASDVVSMNPPMSKRNTASVDGGDIGGHTVHTRPSVEEGEPPRRRG